MKELRIRVLGKSGLACGNGFDYNSATDPVYPLTQYIVLGTDTGYVEMDVTNFLNSPVKVIASIDGVPLINTGYFGDDTRQVILDDYNTANGYPLETMFPNVAGDVLPFYFDKTTTANQTLRIDCYAPLSNAQDSPNHFRVFVKCPDPNNFPT